MRVRTSFLLALGVAIVIGAIKLCGGAMPGPAGWIFLGAVLLYGTIFGWR